MTTAHHGGGPCRKVRFPTLADAERALMEAQLARVVRGSTRRREVRAYACRTCSAWHLTSKPAPPKEDTAA